MNGKRFVFIGSSSEGFSIAEMLEQALSDLVTPQLWSGIFDYNESYLDSLLSKIAFFDYAVLVGTGDDVSRSRGRQSRAARDNVLFEFGLFAGGLGRARVFFVVEEGVKIPSDLSGISLPEIRKKTDPLFHQSFDHCVQRIRRHIIQKEQTSELGFLPSTAIAYGYFTNFVKRTVERLYEDRNTEKVFNLVDGKSFIIKELKFCILIPDDLAGDMFDKVKAKRFKEKWQKLKVDPKDVRDYDFSIDVSRIDDGELKLVDVPLTLNALNHSIDLYTRKSHIGKDDKERLLEQKEIRNFKKTLDYLIHENALTRDVVTTEVVDI